MHRTCGLLPFHFVKVHNTSCAEEDNFLQYLWQMGYRSDNWSGSWLLLGSYRPPLNLTLSKYAVNKCILLGFLDSNEFDINCKTSETHESVWSLHSAILASLEILQLCQYVDVIIVFGHKSVNYHLQKNLARQD